MSYYVYINISLIWLASGNITWEMIDSSYQLSDHAAFQLDQTSIKTLSTH